MNVLGQDKIVRMFFFHDIMTHIWIYASGHSFILYVKSLLAVLKSILHEFSMTGEKV